MEQAAIKSGAMGTDTRSRAFPGIGGGGYPTATATNVAATTAAGEHTAALGGTIRANPVITANSNNSNSVGVNNDSHGASGLPAGGESNNGDFNGGAGGGMAGAGRGGRGGIPGPGGGDMASNGESLEQIYQSTRMWCRTLRRSPNAMEVLIAFSKKNPRLQSGSMFNQYLSDLTGIMYRRLSTTVEEEVSLNLGN